MFHELLTLTECETVIVTIATGSISFSSNPPGADIYLIASGGGPPINTTLRTPNIIFDLPVGNYDYILRLQGFEDHIGTIIVEANVTTPVIVDLIPSIFPTTSPSISPEIVTLSGISVLGILLITTSKNIVH